MLNQKSLLMTVALLSVFTLTTTGCGKSKESRTGARSKQAEQAEPQVLQQDQILTTNDGSELMAKSDGATTAQAENAETQLMTASGEGDSSSDLSNGKSKSSGSKAAAIQFDEAEAVKTGGKLNNLNYTSASSDGLMAEFRGYNNKQSAEQKQMNLNLAKAIVSAKLKRSSGDMEVELSLDESLNGVKRMTSYKLKAVKEGDKYALSQVSANGDLEFQAGFLKCIDADGGCENAYIKVKMQGAYARVIFRNSYAERFFLLEEGSAGASFELWKTYLMNTVSFSASAQKIDYVQTSSFEVVNGRSNMSVRIVTLDKEVVALSIPLLAEDKGTRVSAQVTKSSESTASQKLASAIRDVKLINNNGKGDVRLFMDLSSGAQSGAMALTLSRLQKPTLSIAQVQGFEAKVPKF